MKDILYFNTLEDIKIVDMLRTTNKEKELPNQIILTIQSAGSGEVTPIFLKEGKTEIFASINDVGTKFILDNKEIPSDNFQVTLADNTYFGLQFEDSKEHILKVSLTDSAIRLQTFIGNAYLKEVIIGTSINEIGDNAFDNCTSLTSVTIGNSVTMISPAAFASCTSLTSVTIGNSVTWIGESAFGGCTGLTSVTIPSSVISIGSGAFSGCGNLISITSLAITAPTISANTFQNVKTNGTLHVPPRSNYSTWMSTSNYYLGKYIWTKVEDA